MSHICYECFQSLTHRVNQSFPFMCLSKAPAIKQRIFHVLHQLSCTWWNFLNISTCDSGWNLPSQSTKSFYPMNCHHSELIHEVHAETMILTRFYQVTHSQVKIGEKCSLDICFIVFCSIVIKSSSDTSFFTSSFSLCARLTTDRQHRKSFKRFSQKPLEEHSLIKSGSEQSIIKFPGNQTTIDIKIQTIDRCSLNQINLV